MRIESQNRQVFFIFRFGVGRVDLLELEPDRFFDRHAHFFVFGARPEPDVEPLAFNVELTVENIRFRADRFRLKVRERKSRALAFEPDVLRNFIRRWWVFLGIRC